MNIEFSKDEIRALKICLSIVYRELCQVDSAVFDYDRETLRDGNLNKIYSKLAETLYLEEHKINKLK